MGSITARIAAATVVVLLAVITSTASTAGAQDFRPYVDEVTEALPTDDPEVPDVCDPLEPVYCTVVCVGLGMDTSSARLCPDVAD